METKATEWCPKCKCQRGVVRLEPMPNRKYQIANGIFRARLRISDTCEECFTEMRYALIELLADIREQVALHMGDGHILSGDDTRRCRVEEEGLSGASMEYQVTCSCGELELSGKIKDSVPIAAMTRPESA
jgi:hypothetical protein